MRLQLALNVENLDQSIAYYSKMFGEAPHKTRKGYANFAIDNPAAGSFEAGSFREPASQRTPQSSRC